MATETLRAFSSEVETGSRQDPNGGVGEYASKQQPGAPIRFHRIGKGSGAFVTEEKPTPAAMRKALRAVASTVHVVGFRSNAQKFLATTVTAVAPVSLEPPTLAVCLNRSGAMASALSEGALVSISALTREQVDVAGVCAGAAPHHERDIFFEDSVVSNTPAVRDAQTVFICRCGKLLEWGTHLVVFAEVVGVQSNEDIDPLLYFDGQYGRATSI